MNTPDPYRSPWPSSWREETWRAMAQPWDLIVIGGGITGAGIFALAARMGLRVLLLEQDDFAAGTSSRSSKLVHGGLRYLKHMQVKITWESVRERQRLLRQAPGLVTPLNFIYPVYMGDSPGTWLVELGLEMYTHLGRSTGGYQTLDTVDILMLAPGLSQRQLESGYLYGDAQTDDARLVLRIIHDALLAGEHRVHARNYTRVRDLIRSGAGGSVVGVQVEDGVNHDQVEVHAKVVINATGAWADTMRLKLGYEKRLRPLRGSHLYFHPARFPVYQAIAMIHPLDKRPLFVYPWQGVTLLGTTDVDHEAPYYREPRISLAEADYLLAAARHYFPDLQLNPEDVISTQAGVRPVIDSGKADPSAETRDHVVWTEEGLLTVTGGKLTTFRLLALDALRAAHEMKPDIPQPHGDIPVLDPPPLSPALGPAEVRLRGRYGGAAGPIVHLVHEDPSLIPHTSYHWQELVWSAQHEAVVHLDDLLFRRLRLGIHLADGGLKPLPEALAALQPHLGWEDDHWQQEIDRTRQMWETAHAPPPGW